MQSLKGRFKPMSKEAKLGLERLRKDALAERTLVMKGVEIIATLQREDHNREFTSESALVDEIIDRTSISPRNLAIRSVSYALEMGIVYYNVRSRVVSFHPPRYL